MRLIDAQADVDAAKLRASAAMAPVAPSVTSMRASPDPAPGHIEDTAATPARHGDSVMVLDLAAKLFPAVPTTGSSRGLQIQCGAAGCVQGVAVSAGSGGILIGANKKLTRTFRSPGSSSQWKRGACSHSSSLPMPWGFLTIPLSLKFKSGPYKTLWGLQHRCLPGQFWGSALGGRCGARRCACEHSFCPSR